MIVALPVLFIAACKKKDKQEDIETQDPLHNPIENVTISDITEEGCTVNWSVYPQDIIKVNIDISEEASFGSSATSFVMSDVNQSSFKIKNLKGSTIYFLRINAVKTDGDVYKTASVNFRTGYLKEKLFVTTTDGFKIETTVLQPNTVSAIKPCVIFMHELSRGDIWDNKPLVLDMMAKGYSCVLFNFRGHGNSTPVKDLMDLLTDKSLVAKDLDAVMKYVKKNTHIDSTRLALVGASIGGIMSVAGNGYNGVKTCVALSGMQDGIYTLFPNMTVKSVFYIVGEKDADPAMNFDFVTEAKNMYALTVDPKKLTIVPGSDYHGTDLLKVEGINKNILEWVSTKL